MFLAVGCIFHIVWCLYRLLFCSFLGMNKDVGKKNYSRMRKSDVEQLEFRVQIGDS